jgi:hypothetical protein
VSFITFGMFLIELELTNAVSLASVTNNTINNEFHRIGPVRNQIYGERSAKQTLYFVDVRGTDVTNTQLSQYYVLYLVYRFILTFFSATNSERKVLII